MIRLRRRRFDELVRRQLDFFEHEYASLIADCEAALRAHQDAPAEEAERRYGDFVDIADTGRDMLEEIRDAYAQTLDDSTAGAYRLTFNERARKRFPRFGFELD